MRLRNIRKSFTVGREKAQNKINETYVQRSRNRMRTRKKRTSHWNAGDDDIKRPDGVRNCFYF